MHCFAFSCKKGDDNWKASQSKFCFFDKINHKNKTFFYHKNCITKHTENTILICLDCFIKTFKISEAIKEKLYG